MKLSALVLTSCLVTASSAMAEAEPSECFAAADAGQSARDAGKYAEARAKFDQCSRDPCPAIVQRDCSQWLEQLNQLWPTIVVRADAHGHDVAAVKVFVDGKLASERLDGRPIEIEPGEHTLRCESEGVPTHEEKIVVTSGEKNRAVTVHLTGVEPVLVEQPRSKVPLILGVAFSALAIAGFVTDAVVGGIALAKYNDMKGTCAPTGSCDSSEVQAMRTKFLIGDVALGAGIGFAVAATVSFVVYATGRPKAPQSALRVGVAPELGGGAAFIAGSF